MKNMNETTLRDAGFENRSPINATDQVSYKQMVWRGFISNCSSLRLQVLLIDDVWRLGKVTTVGLDAAALLAQHVPNGTLEEYVQFCHFIYKTRDVGRM